MAKLMKASEFIEKVKDVAENHKTLYVMGCFGAPMTNANKKRYTGNHEYNKKAARVKMINAASADTFGFDCVCLIKGILWGWNGDQKKTYGGAKYDPKKVADTNADGMIKLCSDVSADFSTIIPGEAVWTNGHIGVYIGDGLVVESTPAWKNCVQITACNNAKSGYNTRKWKKHGKLPYINYDTNEAPKPPKKETSVKVEPAKSRDEALAGNYKVAGCTALHIRAGAGTGKASIGTIPKGTVVQNYGYYSIAPNGAKWLYIQIGKNMVGYCSAKYLKRC